MLITRYLPGNTSLIRLIKVGFYVEEIKIKNKIIEFKRCSKCKHIGRIRLCSKCRDYSEFEVNTARIRKIIKK